MVTLTKEEKKLSELVENYKKSIKSRGDVKEWSDQFLTTVRDKFRQLARGTRGTWTFEFYEALQAINKESIKRDLDPETK